MAWTWGESAQKMMGEMSQAKYQEKLLETKIRENKLKKLTEAKMALSDLYSRTITEALNKGMTGDEWKYITFEKMKTLKVPWDVVERFGLEGMDVIARQLDSYRERQRAEEMENILGRGIAGAGKLSTPRDYRSQISQGLRQLTDAEATAKRLQDLANAPDKTLELYLGELGAENAREARRIISENLFNAARTKENVGKELANLYLQDAFEQSQKVPPRPLYKYALIPHIVKVNWFRSRVYNDPNFPVEWRRKLLAEFRTPLSPEIEKPKKSSDIW